MRFQLLNKGNAKYAVGNEGLDEQRLHQQNVGSNQQG
jgi:hypothetical protein